MSFDPSHFAVLARDLRDKKESFESDRCEAIVRTIIGRSYYGSFLKLREHVVSSLKDDPTIGDPMVEMSVDTEMHGLVIQLMQILDYSVGQRLENLREERNIADYRLTLDVPMDITRANEAIEKADFISSRDFPDEDKIEKKMGRVSELVLDHYGKYRKRRYHET